MILFLDTEFTQLGPDMELLSLALVSDGGQFEFYGERNDVPVEHCSTFAREAVLPLMKAEPPIAGDFLNLRSRLRAFLVAQTETSILACDSYFDIDLFQQVVGEPWPGLLSTSRVDLTEVLSNPQFLHAQANYHSSGHTYHHALNDARALRAGWLAWRDGGK